MPVPPAQAAYVACRVKEKLSDTHVTEEVE